MLGQPQDPAMLQEIARRTEIANQVQRTRNGAANFYFIAVLSVVNSLISLFNGGLTFVVGLGLTQIVDAFAAAFAESIPDIAVPLRIFGLGLSVVIAGVFALFGYFAGKLRRWAFIAGLVLYCLDAILVLVFQDWFGFLFHGLMLWGAVNGLLALNKLNRLLPKTTPDSAFPRDLGT
jgi:hypothetical protein